MKIEQGPVLCFDAEETEKLEKIAEARQIPLQNLVDEMVNHQGDARKERTGR